MYYFSATECRMRVNKALKNTAKLKCWKIQKQIKSHSHSEKSTKSERTIHLESHYLTRVSEIGTVHILCSVVQPYQLFYVNGNSEIISEVP